jgi:hypothetical protein
MFFFAVFLLIPDESFPYQGVFSIREDSEDLYTLKESRNFRFFGAHVPTYDFRIVVLRRLSKPSMAYLLSGNHILQRIDLHIDTSYLLLCPYRDCCYTAWWSDSKRTVLIRTGIRKNTEAHIGQKNHHYELQLLSGNRVSTRCSVVDIYHQHPSEQQTPIS